MNLETIRQEARAVAEELITTAQMKPGQILVVGCSSSEIHNSKLGTDSSQEIGQAVFEALCACTKEHGLYLAAQCCDESNRDDSKSHNWLRSQTTCKAVSTAVFPARRRRQQRLPAR